MLRVTVLYSLLTILALTLTIVSSRTGLVKEPTPSLSLSNSADCETHGENFCFVTARVGGRATLPVELVTDNADKGRQRPDSSHPAGRSGSNYDEIRAGVRWYKYYAGLPPSFHSFRQRLDTSGKLQRNMHLDGTGRTLTISPVRPDDLYATRYIAEIALTGEGEGQSETPGDDAEVFDLAEEEELHPFKTRVYFAIESVPVELGPYLLGDSLRINLDDYVTFPDKGAHFRWATEGAIHNLSRLNVPIRHVAGPTLAVDSLNDNVLGTVITGVVYGKRGGVPGRVAIASQRFLIKKDETRVCNGPPTNRTCTCYPGYELDGADCKDVNECLGTTRCFVNSSCRNTPGSYRCDCPAGYQGDGITHCEDIDECATREENCHERAVCVNTVGSYGCVCLEGYVGDGFDCLAKSEWTTWLPWSSCSGSCGRSSRRRSRHCSHPESGMICDGASHESEPCEPKPCPVDGGWSKWSPWSVCSQSCGGYREKVRACDNPTPVHGGLFCLGEMYQVGACGPRPDCPVDGGWSQWTPWSHCSTTCGPGVQIRRRWCDSPPPSGDGRPCDGEKEEWRECARQFATCFDEMIGSTWGQWGHWSRCSRPCGLGQRVRERQCHVTGRSLGPGCSGARQEQQPCFRAKCGGWRSPSQTKR